MKTIAALFSAIVLLMTSTGCVLIPTPEYKRDSFATRQNLSPDDVRKLKVDVTTREQVLLLFGESDAAFQEQRRFIYLWAHVTALLVGVDVAEISKGYMLEIDFRPDGTVCRCEVRTAGLSELFRHQTIAGVGYAPSSRPAPGREQ